MFIVFLLLLVGASADNLTCVQLDYIYVSLLDLFFYCS